MYYNYVLRDEETGDYYTGFCHDVDQRFSEHQAKQVSSTKQYNSLSLVYIEGCVCKTDALKREKQLKTGFGRGYIKRRIITYLQEKKSE